MKKASSIPVVGLLIIPALFVLMFQSCKEEGVLPTVVQFSASKQSVTEGNVATITLAFSKASESFGSIRVTSNATASGGSFDISISKGQTSATFDIMTVDDSVFQENKVFNYTLSNPVGFRLGSNNSLMLTIIDNDFDAISFANFASNAAIIHEKDSNGIAVKILLSKPAKTAGTITVSFASSLAKYGKDFTTSPAAPDGTVTLHVLANETEISFTVLPVRNYVATQSLEMSFTISAGTGVVKRGPGVTYTLTILNDDAGSFANFATDAGIIHEMNLNGTLVQIPLSRATSAAGNLTISFSSALAVYGKDFITSPAASGNSFTLNVLAHEANFSFAVLPIHNFVATQNMEVIFTIATAGGVVQKGTSLTYSLTLLNDDAESLVNFGVLPGSLPETNAAGIFVEIPFSASAPGQGSITISYETSNTSYGNDFTTVPAAAGNGKITLDVAAGQTSTGFTVLPVNNSGCNGPRNIHWIISFANGSVQKGNVLDYSMTLVDDEVITYAAFTNSTGTIAENNAAGIAVQVSLSRPAGIGFILNVYNNNYPDTYGSTYTTSPGMDSDYYSRAFYLSVPENATSIQFMTYPVNNGIKNGNSTVEFDLSAFMANGSGCFQGLQGNYVLTIVDDD